jgi:hypothetical protein
VAELEARLGQWLTQVRAARPTVPRPGPHLGAVPAPGGAPVRAITYSTSGTQPIPSTTVDGATATVQFTEGVTTLSYAATGETGSQEVTRTLTIRIDAAAPEVSEVDQAGPDGSYAGTDVTVRDPLSGLVRVEALKMINIRPAVPTTLPMTFNPPTADTVSWRMVPVDPAQPVWFTLRATDAAGNSRTVDPVVVQLDRERGTPVATTVELAPGERRAEVTNGTPGVTNLSLVVNGQHFQVAGLRDGESRTLDVGAALRASGNTATLEAQGKSGGHATAVLHD